MPESGILTVVEVEEQIFGMVLFVDVEESLVSLEEIVTREQVNGFRIVELQLFLYHHYQLEHCETLQYQYSM